MRALRSMIHLPPTILLLVVLTLILTALTSLPVLADQQRRVPGDKPAVVEPPAARVDKGGPIATEKKSQPTVLLPPVATKAEEDLAREHSRKTVLLMLMGHILRHQ